MYMIEHTLESRIVGSVQLFKSLNTYIGFVDSGFCCEGEREAVVLRIFLRR